MSRFHNNGKGTWGSHRPDTFLNGSFRRNDVGGCRDYGGIQRPPLDEGPHIWTMDDNDNDDSIGGKSDQLLERLDKFDSWKEDTDRRFENLGTNHNRSLDHRARYDDDDSDGDGAQRRRNWEQGSRSRNLSDGPRDRRVDDRDHRENRGRATSCWNPPGGRKSRHQTGGFDNLQFNHSTSCWEPPPRRASRGYSTYDQPITTSTDVVAAGRAVRESIRAVAPPSSFPAGTIVGSKDTKHMIDNTPHQVH